MFTVPPQRSKNFSASRSFASGVRSLTIWLVMQPDRLRDATARAATIAKRFMRKVPIWERIAAARRINAKAAIMAKTRMGAANSGLGRAGARSGCLGAVAGIGGLQALVIAVLRVARAVVSTGEGGPVSSPQRLQ